MARSSALSTFPLLEPIDRPLVGFIRVSTAKQAEVGKGSEAQIVAINAFAHRCQAGSPMIFGDAATAVGRRAHKSNADLQDAVKLAKQVNGILIVSDVSRLTRNLAGADWLIEQGIDVISVDHGRILAPHELRRAVRSAEAAAAQRNRQVRSALSSAKVAGRRLGNSATLPTAQRNGAISSRVKRETLTERIALALRKHDPNAQMKAEEVARLLNRLGVRTGQNFEWNKQRVYRHLRQARSLIPDL